MEETRTEFGTDAKRLLTRLRASLSRAQVLGTRSRHQERWLYLLILPWIIGFILFQGGPAIASALLSFMEWQLASSPEWVGLDNFRALMRDPLFFKTLTNTLYYSTFSVPLRVALAFFLAILLNQKIRGINFFRTTFFLPSVVSGVAVVLLWGWIFNPNFGIINVLLKFVGVEGPGWLLDEQWAMPALIIMSLWEIGWDMLIYLAGLQGVPQVLYEAAEIDGAGRWDKFRHVTMPLVSPVTFFLLITGFIGSFQVFTSTYILTRGGPNHATLTIALFIYFNAFTWGKMGIGAALAWILFLSILLLTLIQFKLAGRWVHYEQEAL